MTTKYIFISLPEDTGDSLKSAVGDSGTVLPFQIPHFKIGTLDALVQQADDLTKLEAACEGLVSRVSDSLKTLLDGNEDKISQQKTVNDKPTDNYLRTFSWNKVRYRADKPIAELVDGLQKELVTIDNDLKGKLSQYNGVKNNYSTLQRKQTGNLATKSLTPIVDPKILINDSEYLETHLIAVPTNVKKDFLKSYETISPMVVPRSAFEVTHDDEFTLFTATTFKKHSSDFQQKCRENKWTPRPYKYVEGGKEEEQRELDRVAKEERKIWGEALRLSRTGWSESVMIWAHLLALRVFVESVLRYGLPLEYSPSLIVTTSKAAQKVKDSLNKAYSHLGGNAFGRDKRGKVVKDDAALSSEMAAAGLGEAEYTAYVYYDIEL